jgi:signal peptidase I
MIFSPLRHRTLFATAIVLIMAAASYASVTERPLTSVSLDTTLADAHKLAERNPALKVMRVEGKSMLPFFGEGSVLVVKSIASAKLRAGMVVVYHNRFGETVAHRLISATAGGWVAQGYNNTDRDSTLVNESNLIGVVYATFHSSGQIASNMAVGPLLSRTQVAYAAPAR